MEFKPYSYQNFCIDRLINEKNVGLFLEPGLGKTVITLTAILQLRLYMWQVARPLVIAPKTVAAATWTAEARRWDHLRELRVLPVLGSEKQRVRALCTPADVYVTNRENVSWLVDHYKNQWPFDMVVLDESSSFKNFRSKRFKSLKSVRHRISRMVCLTGTPSSNGLEGLWAQIFLLDKGIRLGRTISAFRQAYFRPGRRSKNVIFDYEPLEGSFDAIKDAISDICLSMRTEDYLTLPEIIYSDVPVELSTTAARAYKKLETEMLLQLDENTITASNAGVLTNKLLQLCNGAIYDENHEVAHVHDCKLEAFLELVERLEGQHALVFYQFQHDRERCEKALTKTDLRVRVYRDSRDEQDWNAGKIDILLAHPASCGYGLNLQGGGFHVIWFGLTWSLEQYEQANKRLHRQGQTHPVVVHHLVVQSGMDEAVIAALQSKGDMQSALMNALRVRISNLKKQTKPFLN